MTRTQSISILALLWTAWCFLHSLLISRMMTARMQVVMGGKYPYYRMAYNMFSLLSLIPVVYYQVSLEEKVLFAWPWPWYLLKYGMYALSFLLFYGGFRVYDLQFMLGLKQIQGMRSRGTSETTAFTTKEILGYVRHPWYSGALLLVWAAGPVTDVSLVSKTILTVYIIMGALLEEKKLIFEIGEPYREYRKKVPMLIPWKRG